MLFKTPAAGIRVPPDSPAPSKLATFAFPMIMFTPGIVFVFYPSVDNTTIKV